MHFSGSASRLRISSEVMACSAPSMGILLAKDPVAMRMFFACIEITRSLMLLLKLWSQLPALL